MVQRWDLERIDYEDFEMVEDNCGSYVQFVDYQDLHDMYIDLTIKHNNLVDKLGELYQEN